jgi:hypothetical protein
MKTSDLKICGLLLASFFLTDALLAQSTVIKLPTTVGETSNLTISDSLNNTLMKLNADGGFCVFGNRTTGIIPVSGSSARLMWYPRKSAFRAGYAAGTQWDDANVGNYSTALCRSTTASGDYSIAMGYSTTASGISSTAMGQITTASGNYSTATGYQTIAGGNYSTAIGYQSSASSDYSLSTGYRSVASEMYAVAMGYADTASGENSVAIGRSNSANGYCSVALGYSNFASSNSTAIGSNTTASGQFSTAIGANVSTNGQVGAFIIGDIGDIMNPVITNSSQDNQMTMRFSGGYRLYSNAALSQGVYMNAGVSGWSNVCDRNKKENFNQIDGEQILAKIKEMSITEWNYKGTDPMVKYIGPVAQDFYSAFHLGGKDSLGINTICIDGVNIAAIQALEKRTAELQKANEKIELMEKRIEKLEQMITSTTLDNNQKYSVNK